MQATNKVTLSFTPEVSQVSRDVERDMLAMIGLKAPVYRSDKRAPISTVAVIDRSGSMSGTHSFTNEADLLGSPLALVKDSLHFVINNLTADDKLGIVTFDDSVAVSLPLTLMDVNGKVSQRFSAFSQFPFRTERPELSTQLPLEVRQIFAEVW